MPKKILLIDDEVALCKFVKRNLERGGEYEVTTVHTGEEGLAKAKATEFALVITDYRMPGMDGKAVLTALKAMSPHSPVVLFSVYHDDDETITPEIKSKASGIISKPIDHEELTKVIQEALAESDAA